MSNVIFYFTGTGNSFVIAKDIAEKLQDTKLVSMTDNDGYDIDLPYERIGFVFPVYYYNVPLSVRQFIKKLKFNGQYIFGVASFGGVRGTALLKLKECIEKQGGVLNAGFSVQMPGNYIVSYGAFPKVLQKKLFKNEKKKVFKISNTVKLKKSSCIKKGSIFIRLTDKKNEKKISNFGNDGFKNFHSNNKCTGCGICEKLCPTKNIKMYETNPKWGNKCEMCMRCIEWCPSHAIEYGNKTKKRCRYTNPEVNIKDMF